MNFCSNKCFLTIKDTESDNTNRDSTSNLDSSPEERSTDKEERQGDTNDYEHSISDHSTTDVTDVEDSQNLADIVEESNGETTAEVSQSSTEESDRVSVENLGDGDSTEESESSSTGHIIIVEAESQSGASAADVESKWESKEEKFTEEGQAKPLPSPGEIQGKLAK